MQAARPEQKSTYDNICYHLLSRNTTGLSLDGTARLRWRLIGCAFLAFDRRCTQWQGNLLEQWRQASAGIESMAELGGTSAVKSEINASPSALAVVE